MNRWMAALVLSLVLAVSNFAFQAATGQDWGAALERSWFQAVACFVFAFNVGVWGVR